MSIEEWLAERRANLERTSILPGQSEAFSIAREYKREMPHLLDLAEAQRAVIRLEAQRGVGHYTGDAMALGDMIDDARAALAEVERRILRAAE